MLNASLTGKLLDFPFVKDPVFGFEVPAACDDVPEGHPQSSDSWPSKDAYMLKYS